jgi:predicted phage terminase large subunit-like protein
MIIIMTRWHEDDIVGRLLARQDEFNERWAYFNLPAVAGSDDLLGRDEGSALWPARYNKDRLDTIRAVMGEYWFSAQFQGNPIPDGGSIFKQSEFAYCSMDNTYIHLYQWDGLTRVYERKKCLVFQTADFSLKTKQQNDYSVISTWVKTPDNDLCLVDVFREKVETTRHVSSTRNQFDKWNPGFIVVEEQAGGLNVVNELKKEGVPIVGVPSTVDKVDRARTAAARFQVNKVFFLRGTPFLADVEHELVGFPNGQHDDIVDTISAAAIKLLDMRGGMVEIITGNTKRDTTEVVNNGFQESEKQKRFTIKKRPEGSRQTSRRNFIPGG